MNNLCSIIANNPPALVIGALVAKELLAAIVSDNSLARICQERLQQVDLTAECQSLKDRTSLYETAITTCGLLAIASVIYIIATSRARETR